MANNDKTFIKISNKDIWDKLEDFGNINTAQHEAIILHQQTTNGKVKLNRWIATTALTLVTSALMIVLGWIITN